MILRVHLEGAASYDVGDEIWEESLADAIREEAETIAGHAGGDQLESRDQAHRDALRDRLVDEMTSALMSVGDRYRAPDGVLYSLIELSAPDPPSGEGRLSAMGTRTSEPIVEEVLRFEDLPLGLAGTRRAVVRWSDGTEDAPMTWYGDEVLVCEGDHGNSRLMALGSRSVRRERHRARMRGTFDRAHPGVAAQIQLFLHALGEQENEQVYSCLLSDRDRHYAVFMNSTADALIGALVPPRRPDGTVEDFPA